jgi:hypothetical protein
MIAAKIAARMPIAGFSEGCFFDTNKLLILEDYFQIIAFRAWLLQACTVGSTGREQTTSAQAGCAERATGPGDPKLQAAVSFEPDAIGRH